MNDITRRIGIFLITWCLSLILFRAFSGDWEEKSKKYQDDQIKGQVLVSTLIALGVALL